MISIIRNSLEDKIKLQEFNSIIDMAFGLTQKKRFYMSTYGYENAKDVLLGKTDVLTKAENYDRFELDNVVKWWRKLATKRYDKLIAEKRVRKELEVWNKNTMNKIDIIR